MQGFAASLTKAPRSEANGIPSSHACMAALEAMTIMTDIMLHACRTPHCLMSFGTTLEMSASKTLVEI